jgi:hypothetical protein
MLWGALFGGAPSPMKSVTGYTLRTGNGFALLGETLEWTSLTGLSFLRASSISCSIWACATRKWVPRTAKYDSCSCDTLVLA